jgi:hypothetical protein
MFYPFQKIPKTTMPVPALPPPVSRFPFPTLKQTVYPPHLLMEKTVMHEKQLEKKRNTVN